MGIKKVVRRKASPNKPQTYIKYQNNALSFILSWRFGEPCGRPIEFVQYFEQLWMFYFIRSPEKRRSQRQARSRSPSTRGEREKRDDRRYRHNTSPSPSKDRGPRSRSPLKRRSRSPALSPPRKSRKPPSPVTEKTRHRGGSAVTK